MYKKKYLKYKNKYILLKNQIGGAFNNLTYLGEGAETIVFKMETGKALKIVKNTEKFMSENEKDIIDKLTQLDILNFPKYYSIGTCQSNTTPDKDTHEFCIDGSTGKKYQYIIMDTIRGNDMMNIFYDIFKDHVSKEVFDANDVDFISRKKQYIDLVLNVSLKMIRALKLADIKYGFRHNDLDYRNCLILENGTPVIIDFGQSEIGKKSESQCKDINSFLNSVLKNSYCNSSAILDKKYPGIDEAAKQNIICNCKKIFENITSAGKGKELLDFKNRCSPFMQTDIKFDEFDAKLVELLSH